MTDPDVRAAVIRHLVPLVPSPPYPPAAGPPARPPDPETQPMTDKPYTDADVKLVAATFVAEAKKNPVEPGTPPWLGVQTRMLLGPTEHDIARAALDALAAAGRLAPVDDDPRHIIEFRTDGWTIKHPLACRPQLFQCAVTHASGELDGPPVPPGRYAVTVDDIHGQLRIGDRVDQEATPPEDDPADTEADQVAVQNLLDDATRAFADAGTSSERVEVIRDLLAGWYAAWPASAVTDEHEGIAHQLVALVYAAEARAAACPCLPGAPEHRHGVGGYSADGEPGQHHHVIAFAGDGTWSLEHPTAECEAEQAAGYTRPSVQFWDCQVRRLAERQITPDLAQLVAGGRYTCSAGTLGDVFQLGERLHDDQCTTPVCAACGCWCHAEEQTDDEAAASSVIAASSKFARAAGNPGGPDWVRLRTGSGRQYEGHRSPTCPGDGQAGHRHDIRCIKTEG